jgi:hypothetical protein
MLDGKAACSPFCSGAVQPHKRHTGELRMIRAVSQPERVTAPTCAARHHRYPRVKTLRSQGVAGTLDESFVVDGIYGKQYKSAWGRSGLQIWEADRLAKWCLELNAWRYGDVCRDRVRDDDPGADLPKRATPLPRLSRMLQTLAIAPTCLNHVHSIACFQIKP